MRTTANSVPTASSKGNARAYGPGWACSDTATDAIPMTSATYSGFGANWMHAAAASAHASHTPACQVARARVAATPTCAEVRVAGARDCVVVVTSD